MQLVAWLLLGIAAVLPVPSHASTLFVSIDEPESVANRSTTLPDTVAATPIAAEQWQTRERRLQSCAAMYICTAGDVLTGPATCTSTQSTLTGYVCTSGDALDAVTHICTHRTPKVINNYVCTGSDTLSGTTCYSSTISVAATCPFTVWSGGCYSKYAASTSCTTGWAVASAGRCSKDLCTGTDLPNSCNSKCYTTSYNDNIHSYVANASYIDE
jgi:hypothetical protein